MDAIAKWKPTLNKLQEQFQKKKDVEGKRKFTSGNIGLYLLFNILCSRNTLRFINLVMTTVDLMILM